MQLFIKNVKIVNPLVNNKISASTNIFIKNGKIEDLGPKIIAPSKCKVIEGNNLHCSIGWTDIGASLSEPGFEHRETLESLTLSAAKGGFTGIAPLPTSNPPIQNVADVKMLLEFGKSQLVDIFPIATITNNTLGEGMNDLLDLKKNGAVAFAEGKSSLDKTGVLLNALQYLSSTEIPIFNLPKDPFISKGIQIHEGVVSTKMGVKGQPTLGETLTLGRDIELAECGQGTMHHLFISSKESVKKIKLAKKTYTKLSTSVPVLNLVFTDENTKTFDSNFKVYPPLRTKNDKQSLIKGLLDGTIDIISSNHTPLDVESHFLEFQYAKFGVIQLESVFSLALEALKKNNLPQLIKILGYNARLLINQVIPEIKKGSVANLTIFDPTQIWEYKVKERVSKSKNTPLEGRQMIGKVIGVVNGREQLFNL